MSDKFDHIIRDHVDSHEYDLDPQEIWDGINQKRKKKRGFWVWTFRGLGVGLLALALFALVGESMEEQVLSMPVSELNTSSVEMPSSTQAVTTDEQVMDSVSPFAEQPLAGESTSGKLLNNKLQKSQTSKANLLEKDQGVNQGGNYTPASFVKKSELQIQSNKIAKKKIQFDVPTIEQLVPMAHLSAQSIGLPYRQRSRLHLENAKYTEIINPMVQPMWALTLTSGYSLMDRNLSSTSVDQGSLDRVLDSEEASFALNNEFLVHYSFSNNFKISSGLSYQKVVTLFDWNGVLLMDSDGDVLSVYDEAVGLPSSFTNLYYEAVDRTIKRYNQSSLLISQSMLLMLLLSGNSDLLFVLAQPLMSIILITDLG